MQEAQEGQASSEIIERTTGGKFAPNHKSAKPWSRRHPFSRPDFDYIKVSERLVAAGLTQDDLAFVYGVADKKAIKAWGLHDPEFLAACKRGKDVAARRIVASCLRAAVGFEAEDSQEEWIQDTDDKGKPTGKLKLKSRKITKKTYPPDQSAIAFLLCNIDKRWMSAHQMIKVEKSDIRIKIDGKLDTKRIEQLAHRLLPPGPADGERKPVVATEVGREPGG